MTKSPCEASAGGLEPVGFEPLAVLERDPRILLNPRFLTTLHAEMEREVGVEQGRVTLFQMGFLHGLQDAARVLGRGGSMRRRGAVHATRPALRMDLRTPPVLGDPNAIEVRGCWPDSHEASAHLSGLGESAEPVCFLSAGYTSGWLSSTFDANLVAIEESCGATGHRACGFVAREAEAWRLRGDARALRLLAALPFDAFRAAVQERELQERALRAVGFAPESDPAGEFDREAAVIHVWGPVMVLPYSGPEDTLRALDLVGSDPQARSVSVIVLDLAGAIVDEAFGAVALEQIIHTADAWGTELIFAEPSSLSQHVISGLEHPPLIVLKDLEHAIATAFQIAESQKRSV
ncbi:MAG TPA: V4R domain-containing protein [Myxococcota bacterium]